MRHGTYSAPCASTRPAIEHSEEKHSRRAPISAACIDSSRLCSACIHITVWEQAQDTTLTETVICKSSLVTCLDLLALNRPHMPSPCSGGRLDDSFVASHLLYDALPLVGILQPPPPEQINKESMT